MNKEEKEKCLFELALKRQQNCYPGYKNLSDISDGYYECDYVSPYSISAHNVDSDIMLMLHDWSSEGSLSKKKYRKNKQMKRLGYTDLPTNKRLFNLLNNHFNIEFSNTYATNLFPFIKPGNVVGSIKMDDMRKAAREFAIPQINCVQPNVVICFGIDTFNAIQYELGNKIYKYLRDAIDDNPHNFNNKTKMFCQAHPGGKIHINRPNYDQDWKKMSYWYSQYK